MALQRNFFEVTLSNLSRLNDTEQLLFDYVVKNMDKVKHMSIQKLAAERYLSTTTVFRFTQKLGFQGYSDFVDSLLITDFVAPTPELPAVLHNKRYSEEYLKNIYEAVRVMPTEHIERVNEVLKREPNVYILADGHSADIGRYAERLFLSLGLRAYFPEADYQFAHVYNTVEDGDLVVVLSYSGQNPTVIEALELILSKRKPFLLSITRADNNIVQNMSDVNFYIFADEIFAGGVELTSRVSMLTILELLVYEHLKLEHVTMFTKKE